MNCRLDHFIYSNEDENMTRRNKQLSSYVDQQRMDKLDEFNDFCSFYTNFFQTDAKEKDKKVKITFNKKERDDVEF